MKLEPLGAEGMNRPIVFSPDRKDRVFRDFSRSTGTDYGRVAGTGWWRYGCAVSLAICLSGCTSVGEYFHNGFKVGPNYGRPPAYIAEQWIDSSDRRVRSETDDISQWWAVFNDPALNTLVQSTYQ